MNKANSATTEEIYRFAIYTMGLTRCKIKHTITVAAADASGLRLKAHIRTIQTLQTVR
jgi:hypothetical protein